MPAARKEDDDPPVIGSRTGSERQKEEPLESFYSPIRSSRFSPNGEIHVCSIFAFNAFYTTVANLNSLSIQFRLIAGWPGAILRRKHISLTSSSPFEAGTGKCQPTFSVNNGTVGGGRERDYYVL